MVGGGNSTVTPLAQQARAVLMTTRNWAPSAANAPLKDGNMMKSTRVPRNANTSDVYDER